jgi:hypothetical protein
MTAGETRGTENRGRGTLPSCSGITFASWISVGEEVPSPRPGIQLETQGHQETRREPRRFRGRIAEFEPPSPAPKSLDTAAKITSVKQSKTLPALRQLSPK